MLFFSSRIEASKVLLLHIARFKYLRKHIRKERKRLYRKINRSGINFAGKSAASDKYSF